MDKRLYQASLFLAVIGILVSIYMTVYKLTDNNAMCLGSGDCSAVNASKYSVIYGNIPVALVGVFGYAVILGLHLLENRSDFWRRNSILYLFGMGLAGFLFTLYLIYVEFALIKAFCPFCLASQAAMTLIFIVSVIRLIRQPQFPEE